MLEALLGSTDAARVLLFLSQRDCGYGREIAEFWQTNLSGIQKQLDKFEASGILIGETVGRTRVYRWNPRSPFLKELDALLQKAVSFLPDADRKRLSENRRRPRRKGKPL